MPNRRMHIGEVDDAALVLVVKRVEAPGDDVGFGCSEGCPIGEHWHVNSYRGPDYAEHQLTVARLLDEWVRDDA